MTNPVKQHFVPEVYLKRFCIKKDGMLYTLKVKVEHPTKVKLVNKSNICYEPDRYTFDSQEFMIDLNVKDPYAIEKNCFQYENSVLETLFDKIDNFQKFTKSEYEKLLRILFDIKQRNPSYSKMLHEIDFMSIASTNEITKYQIQARELLKSYGLSNQEIDETIEVAFNKIRNKFQDDNHKNNFYRSGFLETNEVKEELINKLLKWEALVLFTDYSNPFITSDNPGFTLDAKNRILNTNFNKALFFVFPISPKSLLILKKAENVSLEIFKQINYLKAKPYEVLNFNCATLKSSNKLIISQLEEQLCITSEFDKKKSPNQSN